MRKNRQMVLTALLVAVFTFFSSWNGGSALAYSDVSRGHWAAMDINLLTSKSIVGGYSSGVFRPGKAVSRAEFAKMILGALNIEDEAYVFAGSRSTFRDVPLNHWAKGHIELAYEMDLFAGYADGTFKPDYPVRRQEAAAILVRALGYEDDPVTGEWASFTDADTIQPWARGVVSIANRRGLVGGFTDGTFRPLEPVTRAQAAVLISRFLALRGDRYDFAADLLNLDTRQREAVLTISRRQLMVALAPELKIYHHGEEIRQEDVDQYLPTRVLLNLNRNGQINFLELVEGVPENVTVKIMGPGVAADKSDQRERSTTLHLFERKLETFRSGNAPSLREPWRSIYLTKNEMNVHRLVSSTGATGQGQVIAIIDTGVDPGHPDLQMTPQGERKIVDWVDLTGEGLIETTAEVPAGSGMLTVGGEKYRLGDLPSLSRRYRYGLFEEERLGRDINHNGSMTDRYLVLVSDTQQKGQYDTVYLDMNGDGVLSEKEGMRTYREWAQVGHFNPGKNGEKFSFVVAEIETSGKYVKLGFDNNGHGTHVAGIAAANGDLQGVAPGAQLLVVKALDSRGETEWKRLEEAVRYAATHGATVVNLSLGYYQDETAGNNSLTYLIDKLSQEHKVVFTIASGNRGPGLATLATPGNAYSAISVGAYISPAMWRTDFGLDVPRESLWYFSSVGPRKDGLAVPTVVAPGSATSTAPTWASEKYYLGEGTSMAAPHAAGAVALLLESAGKAGKKVTPQQVKKAIEMGARVLPQFSPVEAGHGVLDVYAAWKELSRIDHPLPLLARTYNRRLAMGEGLYAREFIPAQLPFTITSYDTEDRILFWRTSAEWIRPLLEQTKVPAGNWRKLPLVYHVPDEPGLYTAYITGDMPYNYGPDLEALATVVVPYQLDAENQYQIRLAEELEAAQYQRYFFNVPPGAGQLMVGLTVPQNSDGRYRGRARFHLVQPDGTEVQMTEYAGSAAAGGLTQGQVGAVVENPVAGVWEVVVYSSATLGEYGLRQSRYDLVVRLEDVDASVEKKQGMGTWVVGITPKKLVPGEKNYLTLHARDSKTMRPASGTIEINGRLYQLEHGKVTFEIYPESDQAEITIGKK